MVATLDKITSNLSDALPDPKCSENLVFLLPNNRGVVICTVVSKDDPEP